MTLKGNQKNASIIRDMKNKAKINNEVFKEKIK